MRGLGARGVADATRLFTMSLSELLDRWFESEQMKTIMMVDGLIGQWSGPDEPGSAYVLLHHAIGGVGGSSHTVNWGFPQGGMGAVADVAPRRRLELRLRGPHRSPRCPDPRGGGRAVGVALATGEELRAPIVVSCVHPKIAFLQLLERGALPEDFVFDIERWKSRSGVVKINVAMAELPDFIADPGTELQDHHTGSVELCLSREYAERAFQDAHLERRAAAAPFVDGAIPTTMDRELAPDGVHVFSMFSQWVPHEWSAEPHREELEAYADRAIDGYTELAPNFRDAVIDRQVIGPYDMEQDLGLIGGNIFHGELTVDQLFHMRPSPGLCRLPHADPGSVSRLVGDARRRRRQRHPGLAGVPSCQGRHGAAEVESSLSRPEGRVRAQAGRTHSDTSGTGGCLVPGGIPCKGSAVRSASVVRRRASSRGAMSGCWWSAAPTRSMPCCAACTRPSWRGSSWA